MESGSLKVGLFPFRLLGLWLFCMIGSLVAYIRFGTTNSVWVYLVLTFVFWGPFYCEYNRSVKWDAQGIRHRWRGRGYFVWELTNEYMPMVAIADITSDRTTNPWPTSKAFMNLVFSSANGRIDLNPSYFRREEMEQLLKYIHEAHPDVVFDDDAMEFMDGGFVTSFPYRINIRKIWAEERERVRKDAGLR